MPKNEDPHNVPEGFSLDAESLVNEQDDVYLHDDVEDPEIFLLDESKNIVIPGPQGVRGVTGKQGRQGLTGIQGTQGENGVQGIPGEQGANGNQGIPGEPIEWEFCELNHDKLAGIRFKQGNAWSQCVRFKGRDGEDGIDGKDGIDGRNGGGGGGGAGANPTTYIGGVATVVDTVYFALDSIVVLVDTSINSSVIYLPDAITHHHKHFHVKWIRMDDRCHNEVIIATKAGTGQLIDGEDSHIMAELYDSLHMFSNGHDWYII